METDRRQLLKILSASGALALGGTMGRGMLKQLLATQCEKPGYSGCGGGGTNYTPYMDWANVYSTATLEFDLSIINNDLAPIWRNYVAYGQLSSSDIASFNAALYSHANFHIGSGSGYHYNAPLGSFNPTARPNRASSTSRFSPRQI